MDVSSLRVVGNEPRPTCTVSVVNTIWPNSVKGTLEVCTLTYSGSYSWQRVTIKSSDFGTTVASANTIVPTGQTFHITGSATINTITPPVAILPGDEIRVIPDGAFKVDTAGNIARKMTATINLPLVFTWDGTKWYPSY